MKAELSEVSAAIQKAVHTAREMPEAEVATIVTEAVAGLEVDDEMDQAQIKAAAHRHLHAAADQIREMGETREKPMVNALIGIGLALLANGEDAEAYYSFMVQAAPGNGG